LIDRLIDRLIGNICCQGRVGAMAAGVHGPPHTYC